VFEKVGLVYGRFIDRDVCEAIGGLEATPEIIVAAVHRAGTAFAGYEVMPVLRFDFIAANIAANGIANNDFQFFLWRNPFECVNGILGFYD
jgi:hypothetical protein